MSAEMVAIFLSVMVWIGMLQQQPWCKLTKSKGILAAGACGVSFDTFRKYITGKDRTKQVIKPRKKLRKNTDKIDVYLLGSIRKQISLWTRGFNDDGAK